MACQEALPKRRMHAPRSPDPVAPQAPAGPCHHRPGVLLPQVSPGGAQSLGALSNVPSLRTLRLNHTSNQIGGAGARALAAIPGGAAASHGLSEPEQRPSGRRQCPQARGTQGSPAAAGAAAPSARQLCGAEGGAQAMAALKDALASRSLMRDLTWQLGTARGGAGAGATDGGPPTLAHVAPEPGVQWNVARGPVAVLPHQTALERAPLECRPQTRSSLQLQLNPSHNTSGGYVPCRVPGPPRASAVRPLPLRPLGSRGPCAISTVFHNSAQCHSVQPIAQGSRISITGAGAHGAGVWGAVGHPGTGGSLDRQGIFQWTRFFFS